MKNWNISKIIIFKNDNPACLLKYVSTISNQFINRMSRIKCSKLSDYNILRQNRKSDIAWISRKIKEIDMHCRSKV